MKSRCQLVRCPLWFQSCAKINIRCKKKSKNYSQWTWHTNIHYKRGCFKFIYKIFIDTKSQKNLYVNHWALMWAFVPCYLGNTISFQSHKPIRRNSKLYYLVHRRLIGTSCYEINAYSNKIPMLSRLTWAAFSRRLDTICIKECLLQTCLKVKSSLWWLLKFDYTVGLVVKCARHIQRWGFKSHMAQHFVCTNWCSESECSLCSFHIYIC